MNELKHHYQIKQQLSCKGEISCYLAYSPQQTKYFLKCLTLNQVTDSATIELFESHVQLLAHLQHPHIPRFVEWFKQDTKKGQCICLVQHYIEGRSLAQLIESNKHFTERAVMQLTYDLASVLDYLRSFSPPLLHCNLYPSNILLSEEDKVYLTGFEVIKHEPEQPAIPSAVLQETYGYLPVEVFQENPVPASDIYALGACMIYALSHVHPKQFGVLGTRLDFRKYVNISEESQRVLEKCVEPDLHKRYTNARQLMTDLEKLLDSQNQSFTAIPQYNEQLSQSAQKNPWSWLTEPLIFSSLGLMVMGAWFIVGWQTKPLETPPTPTIVVVPTPVPPKTTIPVSAPVTKPTTPVAPPVVVPLRPLYNIKVLLRFEDKLLTIPTAQFSVLHTELHKILYPRVTFDGEIYTLHAVPQGSISLSVELDANTQNPLRYPGDLLYQGREIELSEDEQVVSMELYQVLHLLAPQDNRSQLPYTSTTDCKLVAEYVSPLNVAWESLGEEVTYHYNVGSVDCAQNAYYEDIFSGETQDTSLSLSLPPTKFGEKYALHIQALRQGRLIGRLFIHDKGGADWNYSFRVIPPYSGTTVKGRLLFGGKPLLVPENVRPRFWFRNEVKNVVEEPTVQVSGNEFTILGLPTGQMGMSVTIDLNTGNGFSYPGDLRAWHIFTMQDQNNPDLNVDMLQILHLTAPQDNGIVMEKWGAECMDKPSFRSPVRVAWEAIDPEAEYEVRIIRLDCLNRYNYKGSPLLERRLRQTELSVTLPPSADQECYGLQLHAWKNGKRLGMLITHGSNGYGWDYRFRVSN